MHTLLEGIARADSTEIEALLKAVMGRYAELFPDWELNTISLEKASDRDEQLDRIIGILQRMKSSS